MANEHDSSLPEAERVADVFDRASELEAAFTADAIRTTQQQVKQSQTPDQHGRYAILNCIECDAEIGEGRLRHAPKNTICVECASFAEKLAKHRSKT